MGSRTRSNERVPARAALIAALVLALAGSTAVAAPSGSFSVCLVTAGDTLDASAAAGLRIAEGHGVAGRIMRAPPGGAGASLRDCVQGGADLTIGVGYLVEAPLNTVATAYPRHAFAIVDASVTTLPSRPRNVLGLLFRTEQAGYLVGYAAGLWTKAHRGTAVGSIGGLKIPPVDRYIAGFEAGAKKAFPKIRTFRSYAGSLSNESKCKRAALSQIADGSLVELEVAGRCGSGVLAAAQARHVFGIATETDESGLGPWVMTSALKRVDVAVAATIAAARNGVLKTGVNELFGARRHGIGYGPWSPRVPERIRAAVARQLRLLEAGAIGGIPSTVD